MHFYIILYYVSENLLGEQQCLAKILWFFLQLQPASYTNQALKNNSQLFTLSGHLANTGSYIPHKQYMAGCMCVYVPDKDALPHQLTTHKTAHHKLLLFVKVLANSLVEKVLANSLVGKVLANSLVVEVLANSLVHRLVCVSMLFICAVII